MSTTNALMNDLDTLLGSSSTTSSSSDRQPSISSTPIEETERVEETDPASFKLELAYPTFRKFLSVLEVLSKEKTQVSINVSATGMTLTVLYNNATIAINTFLERTLFFAFACETTVMITCDLHKLTKAASTLVRQKPDSITLMHTNSCFLMKTDNAEIALSGLVDENNMSEVDFSIFEYPIYVRVPSDSVAKCLAAMPASFELKMNLPKKRLDFLGTEDVSTRS